MTRSAYASAEAFDARKALTEGLTALRSSLNDLLLVPVGGRAVAPAKPLALPQPVAPAPPVAPAQGTRAGDGRTVYPSRPDPTDAAAEVWALVERAQAGDTAAFGLIYDRYVDTVFRFIYFRVGNRPL